MSDYSTRKKEAKEENKRYFACLEDGNIIESLHFDDIKILPNVKWIFHQFLFDYFETSSRGTPYRLNEYKCIGNSQQKAIFEYEGVKGFSFIEKVKPRINFPGYNLYTESVIVDTEGKSRKIELEAIRFEDFFKSLIAVCDDLARCKTWFHYDLLKENEMLRAENEKLKKEIEN